MFLGKISENKVFKQHNQGIFMLLEQLAKKSELNVDFHNHLHTGSVLREKRKPKDLKEWVKNLFLEEGFSSLTGILDRVAKTKLDVLYITNSNYDFRYENWTSEEQLELARKAGYEIEVGQYYIFARKGKTGRVIALGKSHEVSTTRGHFLFAGLKREKRFPIGRSLEETLREANDGELKIADHPYVKLKGQNGVMSSSKNPEQDAKKVDAFERNPNFYFPFSLADWKVIKYSKKYHKPLVEDEDGHHPRDIGKNYNIINRKYLNYTSKRAFRDSINNAVKNSNFERSRYRPIPFWRIFHHIMMVTLNKVYHFYK